MRCMLGSVLIVLILANVAALGQHPKKTDEPPARDKPARPEALPEGDRTPWTSPRHEHLKHGALHEPEPPPHADVLRAIAEHRPDLAERLERLWHRSPERFRQVLLRSLILQLEDELNRGEHEAGPPPPLPRFKPRHVEHPGLPPGPPDEFEEHVRALERRNEQLELRSHELAERLRAMRGAGASEAEREPLLGELQDAVNEHFDVRTELRKAELERIERELHRLRQMLENMRRGLERRAHERETIIRGRVGKLLNQKSDGW